MRRGYVRYTWRCTIVFCSNDFFRKTALRTKCNKSFIPLTGAIPWIVGRGQRCPCVKRSNTFNAICNTNFDLLAYNTLLFTYWNRDDWRPVNEMTCCSVRSMRQSRSNPTLLRSVVRELYKYINCHVKHVMTRSSLTRIQNTDARKTAMLRRKN